MVVRMQSVKGVLNNVKKNSEHLLTHEMYFSSDYWAHLGRLDLSSNENWHPSRPSKTSRRTTALNFYVVMVAFASFQLKTRVTSKFTAFCKIFQAWNFPEKSPEWPAVCPSRSGHEGRYLKQHCAPPVCLPTQIRHTYSL